MYSNILFLNGSRNLAVDIPERVVNKMEIFHFVASFPTVFFPSESQFYFQKSLTLELNVLKRNVSISQVLPLVLTMPTALHLFERCSK